MVEKDDLGIFPRIKELVVRKYPNSIVHAVGSRAKGYSSGGKWDFDISVHTEGYVSPREVKMYLEPFFKGEKDENGRDIKIDVFTATLEHKDKLMNGSKLL